MQSEQGAAAVYGLHEDILEVVGSKQFHIVCDLVHLCLCELGLEQVLLHVVPAHFELGEVWMLRVGRADRDDFADQV